MVGWGCQLLPVREIALLSPAPSFTGAFMTGSAPALAPAPAPAPAPASASASAPASAPAPALAPALTTSFLPPWWDGAVSYYL
jgi:hypothetical protein